MMMHQFNGKVGYVRHYRYPNHLMPEVPPVYYRTRGDVVKEIVGMVAAGIGLVMVGGLAVFVAMYAI